MKNQFLMDCHEFMDIIYESWGEEELSFFARLRISLHLFLCPRCAEEAKKAGATKDVMNVDFFPPAPLLEESIMEQIYNEAASEEDQEISGGVSTRGWIIIGCFVLFSLSTAFFGMDFAKVANAQGSSFLLPVGITFGAVLTGYGAFFIGSHLEELSARFKLH